MTERGFTLLECLVAFAVLLLALGLVMPLFGEVLDHSARAAEEAEAASLARAILDRVGVDLPLADGSREEDEAGFRWRLAIAPYGSDEDRQGWPAGAHRVTVTVAWRAAGRERDLTLSTLRLGPRP